MDVDERVIHGAAADDASDVAAEVDCLMYGKSILSSGWRCLGYSGGRCGLGCCHACAQQQKCDANAPGDPMGQIPCGVFIG
jgi:hypothetical protein